DIQDNQGNGQVWAFGTISGGLTGTTGNYAYLDSNGFGSGNTQNADLISPPFDFSNYIDIGIEFKHYFRSYSTSKASFHYSIDGGGSWTQVAIWTANNTPNPATFSITIEELSGQSNVLFKWNYTGTWGYYWCVDNVLIIGDNIAPGMPTVATNPDPANDALNIAVDGTLNWNWGNNTDKYDLWFGAIGNMQLVVSQAAAGDIGTNGSFTYNNLLFNSSYQWKVVSYNTQIGMQVEGPVWEFKTEFGIVDLPFTEDFEAVFPPLGWTIYDVDGAPEVRTWVASTAQNHTPGGNRSAFHNYGPSSQTEDGWLVTPKLALPANSEIELNFWNYNTFPDWYYKNSVLISTGDGTPQTGNFVELWSPASVTASWVQTSIDLSAYAGQEAYIAFRYQGSNAHAWHLDDVSITAEQFIPALTVTPPNQNVTAPAGLTSFTVTSNTAWDVGSDQGWCVATPSGNGNGTITVNFTENTSINIRIATLTVTAAGVDPVLVTVTQAGRVPEPIADVILRPQQMDISDASSRSAVLVKISDYPTDDVRYRLYNGANQYNCWDGTQYVLSNSYALSPLVPGDPTNEVIWWIMFERGNNASVSANYRDRLGPTYAVNHLTISLPDTDPIVNSFTISETLPLNAVYPLSESYVVLGFDSQIGGNLISATASDLTTGEFELIVSTATVIRRLEVRNQLNVLIEEVTGVWEAQNDPQVFDFSGGGTYCEVNLPSGVQALLSGSEVGVDYQLLKDGNPFGEIEPGTGNPIVWYDLEAGSYTVEADNGAITILMNGTVSVTADEALPVSVSIVADQMSVCQGQTVTFTAVPENEGDNPTYQWLVNTIPAGNNHAVFSYIPEAGDQVQLIMTSSLNCVTNSPAWSNSIAAEVLPMVNASVSFTADQNNVCQGTEVEFVAVAIHGGQAPVYQWYVNGTQSGQNSAIFSYIPSNGDLVELSMTSSETCVAVNPVTADPITMNVTPLAVVSVSVNADANPVCSGSGVTLTALPTHPGSMPVYQWFVNDQPVGANSATYTYIPLDNDKVQVELTSNQACATDNPAYSEPVIIQLTEAINASVSIVADIPTPCQGQTVTFTALSENGGADPSFQWFVNNNPAGINSPVFSYDPLDGDLIGLSMTSSLGCVTVNPVYDELPPLIVTPVIVELMASPASAGMVSMSGEAHIGQTVQLTATALDGWEFINWTDSDNQVVSETAVFDLILTACSQSYIAHFGSQTNISGKLVFFNDSETEVVSPYSNGSFMVQLFDEDIPLSPPQQVKQDEPFVFHGLEEQKQYSLRFWDQSNNNLLHSTWGWNNWGSVTAIDALLISHMTTGNPIILNFPWITTTTVDKLSPFAFQLADVNSSHSLSSVDMLLVMFRSVGRPDVAPFPGGKPNFLPFVHPVANLNNLTYPENPTIDFQQFGTYASTSAANSVYHMAELPSLNQGTNYFKLYLVPVGDLNASFMAQSGNKSQTMLLADQQLSLTDAYPKTIPVIINSYAEVGAFNLNLKYDPTQLHIKQLHDYEVYYDQPELGLLSVAFLNEQGKTFWPGDTLMLIDVEVNKALDLSELPFSLTGENIWADVNVQEIDEIVLTMPVLKSESVLIANAKEPQLMIYPNPFVQQTIMRVTVPETATIHLKIYNNLGKMVAVKQWEQSGSKNIEIHGDILPGSGVYSFEAIITSAEKTWLKTNKIIYLGH
ncbi:MAG: choice-of-anchor J domain-containing protein, partial [Bacteroidales bacterium]|nr:choice-of-anchor J domain-containing protein [Bacteroidales bacterium]